MRVQQRSKNRTQQERKSGQVKVLSSELGGTEALLTSLLAQTALGTIPSTCCSTERCRHLGYLLHPQPQHACIPRIVHTLELCRAISAYQAGHHFRRQAFFAPNIPKTIDTWVGVGLGFGEGWFRAALKRSGFHSCRVGWIARGIAGIADILLDCRTALT